jgi:hypothetical protein
MPNGNGPRSRWLRDDEVENLNEFDFGSLARSLGPVQGQLGAALPGVVQGASTGAAAGPWGALIGGLAGGALSLATKSAARPAAAPPPPAPAPIPAPAVPTLAAPVPSVSPGPGATPPPAAAPIATTPGAAPTAAGQLTQLLQNPALYQALGALMSGRAREPGGMPVGAILNLVGSLANNAAYEAEAIDGETDDSYLRGPDGRFLRDPSAPAERAAIVWDRLFPAAPTGSPVFPSRGRLDEAEWFVDAGIAERI